MLKETMRKENCYQSLDLKQNELCFAAFCAVFPVNSCYYDNSNMHGLNFLAIREPKFRIL